MVWIFRGLELQLMFGVAGKIIMSGDAINVVNAVVTEGVVVTSTYYGMRKVLGYNVGSVSPNDFGGNQLAGCFTGPNQLVAFELFSAASLGQYFIHSVQLEGMAELFPADASAYSWSSNDGGYSFWQWTGVTYDARWDGSGTSTLTVKLRHRG